MNQNYDVCIIGAGAAGLAAANVLDPALRICIIDKNKIPGRKILVTGSGRCNITNRACLRHEMTLDFFRGLGLETRCDEEGRYYPYSMAAKDVVKVLTDALEGRDIDWMLEKRAVSVSSTSVSPGSPGEASPCEGFEISILPAGAPDGAEGAERIKSRALILATGGKAAPGFGTTGDGYAIAKSLGHSITRTFPILTGINVDVPDDVAGIRARGKVSLIEDGVTTAEEEGEIQFTKDGVSGICIFDLTPYIKIKEEETPKEGLKRFSLKMDLAPDMDEEGLSSRKDSFGILTEALSRWIGPDEIKNKVLQIKGVWGWDRAQCTSGGVPAEEIDGKTMGSRICPGLYFAGEIMDEIGRASCRERV